MIADINRITAGLILCLAGRCSLHVATSRLPARVHEVHRMVVSVSVSVSYSDDGMAGDGMAVAWRFVA
jgi:hypothetical protein